MSRPLVNASTRSWTATILADGAQNSSGPSPNHFSFTITDLDGSQYKLSWSSTQDRSLADLLRVFNGVVPR